MKLGVIFACDQTGGIGYNGQLPWTDAAEDLKQFKETTMGCPMIMGRKTFDSLPGILPGRPHMVITSDPASLPDHDLVFYARNLDDAIAQLVGGNWPMVWVIGGKRVIEAAVYRADVVRITKMFNDFVCDVFIDKDVIAHIALVYEKVEQVITGSDFAVIEFHRFKPENKGMTLN